MEAMNHPSGLREADKETKIFREGCATRPVTTLDLLLKSAAECMERVQTIPSRKFNHEQCEYLADKLEVVVKHARLFIEGSRAKHYGPGSSEDMERSVENLKLLCALANEIESFIEGCSKDGWIHAAMTLTNISEYVSSVGFNLEMCRVAFNRIDSAAAGSLTQDEVAGISKHEVEIVKRKALMDVDALFAKLIFEMTEKSLSSEENDLAIYLLHRLKGGRPIPPSVSSGSSWWKNFDDWVLCGNFFKWVQVTGSVGRGASATVNKGMWLGTPVAKKTFFGPDNEDFRKEVKILAGLRHTHIMSMFCSVMNRRGCSIVMELMDEDLHTLMQKRCEENSDSPPFSILEAVDIMLQVGEGVNYLHNQGIVHRDLKSMNILVKSLKVTNLEVGYLLVKVADFGLSKVKESSICYSNITWNRGTHRWMAPEIINLNESSHGNTPGGEEGPKYPFKCDIYSFAMVCFEILTGDVPFQDEKFLNNVKKRVLQGDRPNLPSKCPLELKALIMECWDQKPNKRPSFPIICSKLKYLKYLLMTGLSEWRDPHEGEARRRSQVEEEEHRSKQDEASFNRRRRAEDEEDRRKQSEEFNRRKQAAAEELRVEIKDPRKRREADDEIRRRQTDEQNWQRRRADLEAQARRALEEEIQRTWKQEEVQSQEALNFSPRIGKPSKYTCVVCQKPTEVRRRCSRCRSMNYCSRECQAQHWIDGHKFQCRLDLTPILPKGSTSLPLLEKTAAPSLEDNDPRPDHDPLPGIEGLQIVGDPVLGSRLTACGHSVNGTCLVIFQWIRHYRDGSVKAIEGSMQPEYVITADDCDNILAVDCVPMDERNRRGDLVKAMVNQGNWISGDPMMQDRIKAFMTNNANPLFEVNLVEGTCDLATLVLRRSTYELQRNYGRKTVINERYSSQVSINIPSGAHLQCAITCHDRREIYLELKDSWTRDLVVLTFRAFLKAAIEQKKIKPRLKWLRG